MFNCSFGDIEGKTDLSEFGVTSICGLTKRPSTLRSQFRPDMDKITLPRLLTLPDTISYLFFNVSAYKNQWLNWSGAIKNTDPFDLTITELDTSSVVNSNEWAIFQAAEEITISMTVCNYDLQARNMNVSVKRTRASREPTPLWQPAKSASSPGALFSPSNFNTTAIRAQLGLTSVHRSLDDCGVFSLSKPESSWRMPDSDLFLNPPNDTTIQSYWIMVDSQTFLPDNVNQQTFSEFPLCTYGCSDFDLIHGGDRPVFTLISSLFNAVLSDTKSIAHAFQAVIRVLATTIYYQNLPYFDYTLPSSTHMLRDVE
ncbi:hypothetical protein QBC38DRAFT_523644 [Podospora fimiseda]|uniref:Uncharacterized protein n=1 Tax=Podospora fimiseda TaxID=252190 RepID=A0AAN6YN60_9PEZI|nr:hypothetical protein QBC38DRAFT_523644 [Podospora fimiseda]